MDQKYLMQFLGSVSQSVLQANLVHDSHPMGGFKAKPLSRAKEFATKQTRKIANDFILTNER